MIEDTIPQPASDYRLINWECSDDIESIGISLFHENDEYHVRGRFLETGIEFLNATMTSWRAAAAEWEDFTGLPALPSEIS